VLASRWGKILQEALWAVPATQAQAILGKDPAELKVSPMQESAEEVRAGSELLH
jgi:hypothetical protein